MYAVDLVEFIAPEAMFLVCEFPMVIPTFPVPHPATFPRVGNNPGQITTLVLKTHRSGSNRVQKDTLNRVY